MTKIDQMKRMLQSEFVDTDIASPNYIADFAANRNIQLTSAEVVQVSNEYNQYEVLGPARAIQRCYNIDSNTRQEFELTDGTKFTVFLEYDTGILKVLCDTPNKLAESVKHTAYAKFKEYTQEYEVNTPMIQVDHYGHPFED